MPIFMISIGLLATIARVVVAFLGSLVLGVAVAMSELVMLAIGFMANSLN